MSRTAQRVSILGIFLVAFGVVLLLKKFNVIDVSIREILWPALSLLGLFLAGRGLVDGRKGKILGGTVLFLYGIFFFLRSMDGYDIPFSMILPATFAVFGIALLMLFVNRPSEWYFLVPGVLLTLLGASFILTEYGFWYGWEVRDAISTWWPLALVLMGLGMLLRRRSLRGGDTAGWPPNQSPPSAENPAPQV